MSNSNINNSSHDDEKSNSRSKGSSTSSPFDIFLKTNNNKNKNNMDCDRPACEDTVSALSNALNRLKNQKITDNSNSRDSKKKECPPSKDSIGRSSWTLLHSMAAWYPDKPSLEEEQKMTQFMEALSIFYPCTYCADDFQMNLKLSPVKTESRKDLCTWLCEQHNMVNKKLGKPEFDCSMKNLDERWRKNTGPECGANK